MKETNKKTRKNIKENLKLTTLGFTLVELLAVIAILSLIVTLVTPNIMDNLDSKKERLYNSTVKEIERITQMYLTDNTYLYDDINKNGYVDVTVEALCNSKLISCPLNDARDNSNIDGYVRISYENDKYVYKFVRSE